MYNNASGRTFACPVSVGLLGRSLPWRPLAEQPEDLDEQQVKPISQHRRQDFTRPRWLNVMNSGRKLTSSKALPICSEFSLPPPPARLPTCHDMFRPSGQARGHQQFPVSTGQGGGGGGGGGGGRKERGS
eukprot:768782-Hanusia_phi.AAC.7